LSNKEIVKRLFLSPRTVSAHLYRIFPKLGIKVARRAARRAEPAAARENLGHLTGDDSSPGSHDSAVKLITRPFALFPMPLGLASVGASDV
jgi:hypothetical protein